MTNKAWGLLAALGLFGSAMGGCVVGSDDDDDTGGTGGITSGGGSGGTGNSTSGGGTGGGVTGGTGGVAGGGGTGGSVVDCDPTGSTPGACTPEDPSNTCQTCIAQNCCAEYSACVGTNPDDSCGWGGPGGAAEGGEIGCIQTCVFDAQSEGGVADDATIAGCAGGCTTPSCSQATVSPQTSALVACLKELCFDTCLQQ